MSNLAVAIMVFFSFLVGAGCGLVGGRWWDGRLVSTEDAAETSQAEVNDTSKIAVDLYVAKQDASQALALAVALVQNQGEVDESCRPGAGPVSSDERDGLFREFTEDKEPW